MGAVAKLILGDCFEKLKEIPDESVDLILTDPPYGIDFLSTRTNHHHRLVNDDIPQDQLYARFLPEARRVLKPRGVLCCCCGGGGKTPSAALAMLEISKHMKLIQTVVWSKGKTDGSFVGLGWKYRPSYELVVVAGKNEDYAFYSKPVSNVFVCKPHIPKKGDHPTQKPIALMEFFIKNHTKEGDLVLDPFMGSGTTGVACLKNNRNFIGIEIDEGYYKLAEKRISGWRGQEKLVVEGDPESVIKMQTMMSWNDGGVKNE